MAYITGFCAVGFCEGKHPVSPSGKHVKVCTAITICTCDCHQRWNKMSQMTGEPREPLQNPLYEPHPNPDLSFLDEMDKMVALTGGVGVAPEPLQRVSTDTPGLWEPARTFTITPNGRRQRGQLEAEVLLVCNRFMDGQITDLMTPAFIASQVSEDDPPSVGAVNAILYRWEEIGFIRLHKKPLVFVSFTPAGLEDGLEVLKARSKRRSRNNA